MEKILSTTVADRLADGHVPERLSHRLGRKPVLVGRDLESSFLENYLDAAQDGQGHVVLISGKSGIGKTRLVQELMSTKTSRGEGRIMIGFCRFQKKMTPYYPIRQIMSGFVERTENGDHGERIVSSEGLTYPQFPWDITFESNGFDDGEGSEDTGRKVERSKGRKGRRRRTNAARGAAAGSHRDKGGRVICSGGRPQDPRPEHFRPF